MNCEFCQSPVHIWFQCPKKPDGWKPARLAKKSTAAGIDRSVIKGQAHTRGGGHERTSAEPGTKGVVTLSEVDPDLANQVRRRGTRSKTQTVGAGTQALPVDTNSLSPVEWSAGPQLESRVQPAPGAVPTPGTKFDKRAWMREYMREYMRKRRASLKS